AKEIERIHMETSILTYNDENALACIVSLAYYSARVYYTIIREFPTGKGFADIVFIPRKEYVDKPAMIIELKWNQTVDAAVQQIKEKKYQEALQEYSGNILYVGINYDKQTKKHRCKIVEGK
ncbi:MAG: PD-(D/E)XK nuclease domain-containing protein, partial [Lachnospiraceae bacterium]|nr:PD-(D/E)XK nuclease domain-containing protein [Lachnospiraceae bacterium]